MVLGGSGAAATPRGLESDPAPEGRPSTRLDSGEWKIVSRHADPLTTPHPDGPVRRLRAPAGTAKLEGNDDYSGMARLDE